jgi:purine-nucleoside phosphorylase
MVMNDFDTRLDNTVRFLKGRLPELPDTCIMLGTGLGGVAAAMDVLWEAPYGEIPDFPVSTAPDHAGRLLVGKIGGHIAALFQGRFHYYEGYSTKELAFPVQVMAALGVKTLIGCNAAGGLNLYFSSGDIMLIEDHINFIPENPLRGPNPDSLGERFPDMSRAWTLELRQRMEQVAEQEGIRLRKGVFVAVPGPSLETPAETRFLSMAGADAVAMSLVPEVIAAVHAGMDVLGLSIIANVNDPDNFEPILIEDVIEQAGKAEKRLERLLVAFLKAS